ncbi:MAG: sigma factor [Candidatus Caldatribacteriota bacterium]|nr:sigma factor [Candidatus Caldatribacteriota bacterium]
MSELKELILKAKKKDEKAMEELFKKFKPLLKSRAGRYSRYGLEYEDVFQQGALIFILAVYDFEEKQGIPFSGYIKKRMNWELWSYCRKYLKIGITEKSQGLKIKGRNS